MQLHDMILVSVDDHIIEPPEMFDRHVPAKYKDDAPRVVTYPSGEQRWVFNGSVIPSIAASAVAGRKREDLGAEASRYAELRSGCYVVDARVDDMNANGVLSSLCFPTFTGFAGELFLKCQDRDLALALVQAYNDWHLEDWCGPHPGRFIPLGFVPFWDAKQAVAEIRRLASKGARSVCLPENPSAFGLPSIHREYWSPILEACVESNLVASVHIGTGGPTKAPSPDSAIDWNNAMINMSVAGSMVDWTFSPLIRRFPDLRIALSEGCVGWVPFMYERADAAYKNHRFWTYQDLGDLMPSDIMKRHFLYCFHADPIGLKLRNEVGIDRISWECDYPHCDSTWPTSPEQLWDQVKDFPENEIAKITHKNALDFFDFDPFAQIPREKATVAELRKRALNVDTSEVSLGGGRKPPVDPELGVLTFGSMAKLHEALSKGLASVE